MKSIQEWLGHSNFSTTANLYAHLDVYSYTLCFNDGVWEEDIPAPYSEHDLVNITQNSTCIEGGFTYKDCSRCDYTEGYTDLDPTGHNLVINEEVSYPATCTEDGLDFFECINDGCNFTKDIILDRLGHIEVFASTTAPTCTDSGYDTYICERENCQYTFDVYNVDAVGHDYSGEWDIIQKGDCQNDGLKELHCPRVNNEVVCDELIDSRIIVKRNHNWSEWQTTVEPECEEDGLEVCECLNEETDEYDECTASEQNILPAINHKWNEGVIDPESTCKLHGTKTYTCQNDNSHTYTEAVELNPDNHVGETYIKDEKSATCTEDGYTGDTYCSDCDALLEKGKAISATKHDWDNWVTVTTATCEGDGLEKRICKRFSFLFANLFLSKVPISIKNFIAAVSGGTSFVVVFFLFKINLESSSYGIPKFSFKKAITLFRL